MKHGVYVVLDMDQIFGPKWPDLTHNVTDPTQQTWNINDRMNSTDDKMETNMSTTECQNCFDR